MKKIIIILLLISIILIFQLSQKSTLEYSKHLKYFWFTLVDVGWDDPLDKTNKTNYVDEVAPFSNVGDILVAYPTDIIIPRIQYMAEHNMKAILHVSEIFFYHAGPGGPSGSLYRLRPDYKLRWDKFISVNNLSKYSNLIGAFYIGEEPTWNSISFAELQSATDYTKSTIQNIPIMVIEAYPAINDLQVPITVDWIGFDHYFIKDPKNNDLFRNDLNTIKSKRSHISQKIVLIMDAHYIRHLHKDIGGIEETEMVNVVNSYYELAKSEIDVVAMLGYFWPGGFDDPLAKGGRELSKNAKEEITRIGKEITGK